MKRANSMDRSGLRRPPTPPRARRRPWPSAALVRQPKVRLRISELQSEVASKLSANAAITVEEHMLKLRELRDKAASLNQMSAAINAERLHGELRGF
jgi:hypothetical protein